MLVLSTVAAFSRVESRGRGRYDHAERTFSVPFRGKVGTQKYGPETGSNVDHLLSLLFYKLDSYSARHCTSIPRGAVSSEVVLSKIRQSLAAAQPYLLDALGQSVHVWVLTVVLRLASPKLETE